MISVIKMENNKKLEGVRKVEGIVQLITLDRTGVGRITFQRSQKLDKELQSPHCLMGDVGN